MASWFSRIPRLQYGKESFNTKIGSVYTAYDPKHPPPHPGPERTRFVCISDTHSETFDVPPGDVLLHSGDLSILGKYDQMKVTVDWLRSLPHKVKIVIAGNHDFPLHEIWYDTNFHFFHEQKEVSSRLMELFNDETSGIVYIQDQKHTFQAKEGGREWSVYGFPWQPWFGGWAFNYKSEEAKELVSSIPEVDILLTHGPPHSILDTTLSGEHVGCPELLAHLSKMQRPPLLNCFGHIHESHGAVIHIWDVPDSATDTSEAPNEQESASVKKQSRETIMVNAANQPIGPKGLVRGTRVPCGGPGFQPVIVDILDSVER
ncbi:Metallo-dependent phosphatase-like protein [Scleroderma yunnanense]